MTVLVLDTDEKSVVLAADQQWVTDSDLIFYGTKIRRLFQGGKLIGAVATCGDASLGIRFEQAIVATFKKENLKLTYLERLQEVVEDFSQSTSLPETLIILSGRGYCIDDDGLVLPHTQWAVGAGGLVALGAMWRRRGPARRRAELGCQAAIEKCGSCGGVVDVFEMSVDTAHAGAKV